MAERADGDETARRKLSRWRDSPSEIVHSAKKKTRQRWREKKTELPSGVHSDSNTMTLTFTVAVTLTITV